MRPETQRSEKLPGHFKRSKVLVIEILFDMSKRLSDPGRFLPFSSFIASSIGRTCLTTLSALAALPSDGTHGANLVPNSAEPWQATWHKGRPCSFRSP